MASQRWAVISASASARWWTPLVVSRAEGLYYWDTEGKRYFDAIVVHADPVFARLEETFNLTADLRVPVHYSGFVVPSPQGPMQPNLPRRAGIVVSAGGGRVGEPPVPACRNPLGARSSGRMSISWRT